MPTPFKTPTNERSFSALVDAVIMATGKPASLVTITQYANAVIREVQSLGLFAEDLDESTYTQVIPSDFDPCNGPFTWTVPSMIFRSLRTVKYIPASDGSSGLTVPETVYPDFALPGRAQHHKPWLYYRAQNYFAFKGIGANATLALAVYTWLLPLGYYTVPGLITTSYPGGPYDNREAYYDFNAGEYMYLQSDNATYGPVSPNPDGGASQIASSVNWLITDWYDLILSGTKCKTFTSAGDPRAAAEYSNYSQLKKIFMNVHGYESENF